MKNRTAHLFAIIAIAIYTGFLTLQAASQPIERWDELTNLRVLADSGYPILPLLNLEKKPFLEKPPAWYIAASAFARSAGKGIFPIRMLSVTAGVISALLIYILALTWFGNAGAIATLISYVTTGHLALVNAGGFFSTHTFATADSDGLFLMFIVLSYVLFSFGIKSLKSHLISAGAAAGALGMLTKSPLAVIPVAVFVLYSVRLKIFSHMVIFKTIIIALLPYLVWLVLSLFIYKSRFVEEYLGYHLIMRMFTPIEGHENPWWYYLKVISHPQVYPAFPLSIYGIFLALINKQKNWTEISLLSVTSFLVLILFISQTRLAWYLLPAYPFLSLFAGYAVSRITKRKTTRPN